MSERTLSLKSAMVFVAIACTFAGCASKDDVSPANVEKQRREAGLRGSSQRNSCSNRRSGTRGRGDYIGG